MTTKAIEAGARAIDPLALYFNLAKIRAKRCIEAAIASGELVPASAVAAERERCATVCDKRSSELIAQGDEQRRIGRDDGGRFFSCQSDLAEELAESIRALEPASGEYVLVPREAPDDVLKAGYEAWVDGKYDGSQAPLMYAVWVAMITAASDGEERK